MTTTTATTTGNLLIAFAEVEALLRDLQPDEWDVQSLCPDWSVRGVVCHIAAIEHALCGWRPEREDSHPFEAAGPFLEATRSWSDDELGAETERILARRRAELAELPDEVWTRPMTTPAGPGTYERFMDIRCFDLWVHVRDMTIPLGRASDDGGPLAERVVDEVEGSIGYIVGKRIGLPDGTSITFRLTGPVERDLRVAVDGRARVVDQLDDPTVSVTTDSLTFVLLACGRIDPQLPIDDGRITWTGDDQLGHRAARNLAFTR